jgi:O6-methylguanine-DNA--protein-cysteine methyltransferase
MPQTQQLVETLKQALRGQKKTYADVAKALELSEARVKRLFADKNLSLARSVDESAHATDHPIEPGAGN